MKSYQTAGGYTIPNGATADYFYQVKDWLGSPHVTLSATGSIQNALDYYSYGKKLPGRNHFSTSHEGYRYQFTGHSLSRHFGKKDGETNYQYHGARYYDEDLARYMSVDPLAMQFHAWSPYNYVMGNPIRLVDPDGKAPYDWIKKAGSGQWAWDPKVSSQDQAITKYGAGMEYAEPGATYPSGDKDSPIVPL